MSKKNIEPVNKNFAFSSANYKWLGLGLALLVLGYLLMSGGGSDDPDVFSYDIFNFRRMIVSLSPNTHTALGAIK